MRTRFVLLPVALLAMPLAHAQSPAEGRPAEQLLVTGERVYPVVDSVAPGTEAALDTAELLKQLPGANLNANGAMTGIAQYRGLYGDRVAVSIDGLRLVTGGPNAMDTPLSYASPLLLERLSLERGISSVSSAAESLGGHVSVDHDRGQHGDRSHFAIDGKAQGRYVSNGNQRSTAVQLVAASDAHKIALLGESDRSDDLEYPGGTLAPTRLERDRFDLSYAYRRADARFLVYAGGLDTRDTGTPALAMDIRSIETDIYGLRYSEDLGDRASLDVALSYSGVDHWMDNHGLRTPPPTPAGYRSTHTVGAGYQWRIGGRVVLASGEWRVGLDGGTADHAATITNPNVPAFRIDNFNAAERDLVGLYGQWNRAHGRLDLEAGIRVNRVTADSGAVSAVFPANPMMQTMSTNAALLADAFNGSDLSRAHTNVDAVFKVGRIVGDMRSIHLELAQKSRAPSYQELYLWLPLESTGGLADGRSYIGNPALEPEVSREINIGSNWRADKAWFAPQVFYKDVSDYIQGVPSTNTAANLVATVMGGRPALEFANTEAKIYGIDLAWGYYLTESIVLDGILTHVRGRRTDVSDNLYRLAPLNGRVSLTYEAEQWSASVETIAYAAQDKVAAYNEEPQTPGYGIVNASMQWQLRRSLLLSASVENLLDKRYQDHLDGINRVARVDVPLGERLYGLGRSLQLGFNVAW